MKPTIKLRFVERKVPMHPFYRTVDPDGKTREGVQTYLVLQQWWESSTMGTVNLGFGGELPLDEVKGEWRDVPLEENT